LHSQLELMAMRCGTVSLRAGGESFRLHAGQLAWIAPGVEHVLEELTRDADFWILQLEPSVFRAALTRIDGQTRPSPRSAFGALVAEMPDPPVVTPSSHLFSAIEEAAHVAWRTYLSRWQGGPAPDARYEWIPRWDPAAAARAREELVEVLVTALRATRAERSAQKPLRLARRAFDALLCDPLLSRPDLCAQLETSEGHLSRVFPGTFGTSLVAQRARLRLMQFLTLSRRSRGSNLLASCLEAGFGSYAQLHRVFATHSAFGPREYLKGSGHLLAAKVTR
jgi:AraC-like DNA-binding protein